LLEKLPPDERGHLLESLRSGSASSLAARADQMRAYGIAAAVVEAIEKELLLATEALAAHRELPPSPLLLQLTDLLGSQVAALQADREGT
jgi:hypothetical protein